MKKKQAKGILPSESYYTKKAPVEDRGLYYAIQKHPEAFAHIKKNFKGGRTLEEWIKEAEKLAKDNKWILPSVSWLKKNKYSGLYEFIKNHPDSFSHIKQEKKIRTLEEWIKEAEKLAKDNKGILPFAYWLIKNGYSGLDHAIRKHPESFSHLKQENTRGKTLNEWIKEAEKLAKDNKGILPCYSWLIKNGYIGLNNFIRKYPESFSHIEQEKKIRTLNEWIKIAEKLAKDNKGILPCASYLRGSEYKGLSNFIRKHPDSFSHLKQEKKIKNLEKWIKEAEKLAKDNKGILPCASWLNKNKYSGLSKAIKKYPESFSHIKQEYRGQIKFIGQGINMKKKQAKGTLPSESYYRKKGKSSLYAFINNYS